MDACHRLPASFEPASECYLLPADQRNGSLRLVGNQKNHLAHLLVRLNGGSHIRGSVYLPFKQVLLALRDEKSSFFAWINLDFVFLPFPDLGFCNCLAFRERLDESEIPEPVVQELKGLPLTDRRLLGAHNDSDEPHAVALGGCGKMVAGRCDVSRFQSVDRGVLSRR